MPRAQEGLTAPGEERCFDNDGKVGAGQQRDDKNGRQKEEVVCEREHDEVMEKTCCVGGSRERPSAECAASALKRMLSLKASRETSGLSFEPRPLF